MSMQGDDRNVGMPRRQWRAVALASHGAGDPGDHARRAHRRRGADLTEGYTSQAAADGARCRGDGHAQFDATLNGEGLTMARGELSTGSFGEGYVDRRHPHTYLHELVLTGAEPRARSLTR